MSISFLFCFPCSAQDLEIYYSSTFQMGVGNYQKFPPQLQW